MSSRVTFSSAEASALDIKLYSVLREFNVYELNRLSKFVNSPYFNKNERLIRLFVQYEGILRTDSENILTRAQAWSYATLGTEYNDQKFRKLCSDLLRLIEQFLIQEEFDKNPLHKADYLLQAIHDKRLESLTRSSIRTAHRLSDQYYVRPASYFYYQYEFERAIYSMKDQEINRSKVVNVEEISAHLDTFFIAEKLRYYCYALARKPIVDHHYDFLFLEEIIRQVEVNKFDDITPINFYYQIYLTQKYPEVKSHYLKLKSLIRDHLDELPSLEAKEIMDAASNFCIQKTNEGHDEYIREYFDLYKESLRNELIFVNGVLDQWDFRNLIFSGLRLGEYGWVESFIMQYQSRLDDRYRINAVSFNLANLYFYQKKYSKVLQELREVEYEDPSYNRNSKTMLIATYYELDEIEPLMSLLSSFSIYLRRTTNIAAKRKDGYHNLIKYLRALIRTTGGNKEALVRLRAKVESTDLLVNKTWLLEKIDEMLY
jgi:hypothetical protein